ncbi:hypothetical protein AB4Z01_16205 [Inquilinus sp. YAF38]|uniref:hypothetical protein n=1 Tax=Inquilinus sp. YAF38 TaxID=3233084 RepID=UPI003F9037AD
MLHLPRETEQLARLMAVRSGRKPEDVIRAALEREARALGVVPVQSPLPVDMEKVNAITRRATNRPLLDPRSASEILDEAWSDAS